MFRPSTAAVLIGIAAGLAAMGQAPAGPAGFSGGGRGGSGGGRGRMPNPTRDPHTEGYVKATELPDGQVPSPTADGNFIIGPTHTPAPEIAVQTDVPHGKIIIFSMESVDGKIYPGIARGPAPGEAPTAQPTDPSAPRVVQTHPQPWTRKVGVYIPKQYVPGSAAPFIVGADGLDMGLFTVLDNLIAAKKIPVMIGISIQNG